MVDGIVFLCLEFLAPAVELEVKENKTCNAPLYNPLSSSPLGEGWVGGLNCYKPMVACPCVVGVKSYEIRVKSWGLHFRWCYNQ